MIRVYHRIGIRFVVVMVLTFGTQDIFDGIGHDGSIVVDDEFMTFSRDQFNVLARHSEALEML